MPFPKMALGINGLWRRRMTYLLRLVACLFLCASLNSFAAPITYQFTGEVTDSWGNLSAPLATTVLM